jgi:hypothetical protein
MQINNRNTIRFLSGLSFLIFFCPFFQMCSDKSIEEAPFTKEVLAEPSKFTKEELKKFENEKEIEIRKRIIETKKIVTFNAYDFIYKTSGSDSKNTFKELFNSLDEIDTYGVFSIILIIMNSLFILIYSFLNKLKIVIKLNKIGLSLLALSLVFFYLKIGLLEDINQIKIGYYLFFINSIGIIYFCNKELKKTQ